MTILSYVGDLSNIQPDTRIRRFTNAEACEGVGTIAGFYAGSLIVQYAFGDFYIFIICASSCLVAFIYGILRIENIIPEKEIDGDDVIEVILKVTICIIHFIFFTGKSCYKVQEIFADSIPEKGWIQKGTNTSSVPDIFSE